MPPLAAHIPLLKAARRGGYAGCGFAAGKRRGCFGGMRSDDEKDGSDPILTCRHFAERLDGTGKM